MLHFTEGWYGGQWFQLIGISIGATIVFGLILGGLANTGSEKTVQQTLKEPIQFGKIKFAFGFLPLVLGILLGIGWSTNEAEMTAQQIGTRYHQQTIDNRQTSDLALEDFWAEYAFNPEARKSTANVHLDEVATVLRQNNLEISAFLSAPGSAYDTVIYFKKCGASAFVDLQPVHPDDWSTFTIAQSKDYKKIAQDLGLPEGYWIRYSNNWYDAEPDHSAPSTDQICVRAEADSFNAKMQK